MDLHEELLSTKTIYQGKVFDVQLDTVRLPDDKKVTREFVVHKQAVAILPIREDGTIVLVRQYRHCTKEALLEIPAGSIDDDEKPEEALQRELSEETGFIASSFSKLCAVYTTPGFTNEFTHFYVATGLIPEKRKGDDDEFIEVVMLPAPELQVMIRDGRIKDAKTVLAVCAYFLENKA